MKRKIDKYDPVVYPRLLWVATEITDLDKMFVFCNINDFTKENPDTYKNLVELGNEVSKLHYLSTGIKSPVIKAPIREGLRKYLPEVLNKVVVCEKVDVTILSLFCSLWSNIKTWIKKRIKKYWFSNEAICCI